MQNDLAEFLLARCVKLPNGCWPWTGCIHKKTGYGQTTYKKRSYSAHRLSFICFKGPVPKGKQALHDCDTRPCINPDHLYAGTHRQNMEDRSRRGRLARGERHGCAKLTNAQVLAMRADPRPLKVIAAELGIAYTHASMIRNGHRFRIGS